MLDVIVASQTLYLDCLDVIRVNMHFVSTLFDSMGTLAASNVQSDNPLNFEALNQANGRHQLYVNQ